MHSSGMRTARLTVSQHALRKRGCICLGVYLSGGCTCPGNHLWTDRRLWKHNFCKLRLLAVTRDAFWLAANIFFRIICRLSFYLVWIIKRNPTFFTCVNICHSDIGTQQSKYSPFLWKLHTHIFRTKRNVQLKVANNDRLSGATFHNVIHLFAKEYLM